MNSHSPILSGLATSLGMALVTAQAATFIDLSAGLSSPPAILGGHSMTLFVDDARANFTAVSTVPSPLGGALDFDSAASLREIGDGWDTWSHGYAGDVYVAEGLTSLRLALPPGTMAFSFHVQPDAWDVFEFQVESGGTGSGSFTVDGDSGARFVGVYSTDPSVPLSSILIENVDGNAGGFAVGEFAIAAVPEPATAAWVAALGCLAFAAWRGRFQRFRSA